MREQLQHQQATALHAAEVQEMLDLSKQLLNSDYSLEDFISAEREPLPNQATNIDQHIIEQLAPLFKTIANAKQLLAFHATLSSAENFQTHSTPALDKIIVTIKQTLDPLLVTKEQDRPASKPSKQQQVLTQLRDTKQLLTTNSKESLNSLQQDLIANLEKAVELFWKIPGEMKQAKTLSHDIAFAYNQQVIHENKQFQASLTSLIATVKNGASVDENNNQKIAQQGNALKQRMEDFEKHSEFKPAMHYPIGKTLDDHAITLSREIEQYQEIIPLAQLINSGHDAEYTALSTKLDSANKQLATSARTEELAKKIRSLLNAQHLFSETKTNNLLSENYTDQEEKRKELLANGSFTQILTLHTQDKTQKELAPQFLKEIATEREEASYTQITSTIENLTKKVDSALKQPDSLKINLLLSYLAELTDYRQALISSNQRQHTKLKGKVNDPLRRCAEKLLQKIELTTSLSWKETLSSLIKLESIQNHGVADNVLPTLEKCKTQLQLPITTRLTALQTTKNSVDLALEKWREIYTRLKQLPTTPAFTSHVNPLLQEVAPLLQKFETWDADKAALDPEPMASDNPVAAITAYSDFAEKYQLDTTVTAISEASAAEILKKLHVLEHVNNLFAKTKSINITSLIKKGYDYLDAKNTLNQFLTMLPKTERLHIGKSIVRDIDESKQKYTAHGAAILQTTYKLLQQNTPPEELRNICKQAQRLAHDAKTPHVTKNIFMRLLEKIKRLFGKHYAINTNLTPDTKDKVFINREGNRLYNLFAHKTPRQAKTADLLALLVKAPRAH